MRRLISYVESQDPLLTLVVIPISIVLRGIFEGSFEVLRNLHFQATLFKSFLFFFLHQGAFYMAVFVWLAVLLSIFSRRPILKAFNFIATFSPLIVLPPLVDLLWGGGFRLRYIFSWSDVANVLANFFNPFVQLEGITYGMRLEITLAMLGLAAYTYFHVRRLAGAVLMSVLTFFVLMFIGSLPGIFAAVTGQRDIFSYHYASLIPDDTMRYAILELLILIPGLIALALLYRRDMALKVLTLRIQKLPFYLSMGLVGFVLGWKLGGHLWPHPFKNPFDYVAVVGLLLALTASHHFGTLINDYYDLRIDKANRKPTPLSVGIMSVGELKTVAWVLFVLAISLFLAIGWDTFILGLATLSFAWLYSAPPWRTKRFHIVGTLTLGLIALFCQYVGASLWLMEKTLIVYPPEVSLATVVGVAFGFMVKDVEDYEGDRLFGVRTNYTLFGIKVGRIISGLFTGGVFILIPFILGLPEALPFAVPLGLVAGFVASRSKFYEHVLWLLFFLLLLPVSYLYLKRPVKGALEISRTYNHYNYAVGEFRKDLKKGERVLDSLLVLLPCDPRLIGLKMKFYRDTDPESALDYLESVRRSCRLNGDILATVAEAAYKVGDTLKAERYAKLSVKAGEIRALRLLAVIKHSQGMLYESSKYERRFRRLTKRPLRRKP
ncbi:MAG: UbiA family prenyltransferase [Thermotogae bacterium]|nr:UbiA family prenyltransferase [Thermotogota bacterium]